MNLLVVDAGWQHEAPPGLSLERLAAPTVLVGTFGAKVGDSLHLKLGRNYGCMCLGGDAIVWNAAHPVFSGLAGCLAEKAPPANFRAYSSILDVPDAVSTLRVLRDPIGKPGYVTAGFGFLDSPECEILAGGFNEKTQEHFAIARQGRFLQWGFAGSPDDYTDEGRMLLANCLRYIRRFGGDPVREFRTTSPRAILMMLIAMEGWRGIGLPREFSDAMQMEFLQNLFVGEIPEAMFGERAQRVAWFRANEPFLRNEGDGWFVDREAQQLGLGNHTIAMLDACLSRPDGAASSLWLRYTGRSLDDVDRERVWLAEHYRYLYFTDWGGYRWASTLDPPQPLLPRAAPRVPEPKAILTAARYENRINAILLLDIPTGFHAYAPGATDGLPLSLKIGEGFELIEDLQISQPSEEHIQGAAVIRFSARGNLDVLHASLRVQLCDSLACLPPQILTLRCALTTA